MKSKTSSTSRDRNAGNGRFEKTGYAAKHPKTAIKDAMKKSR